MKQLSDVAPLPWLMTSPIPTPAEWAIYPRFTNITQPANQLVKQSKIGRTIASLEGVISNKRNYYVSYKAVFSCLFVLSIFFLEIRFKELMIPS